MPNIRPHRASDELIDAVQHLIELSTANHADRRASGEAFVECKACGEWDGHAPTCFVPALLTWMEE